MCWMWLFLAIVLEVAATVLLKLSDGFSRWVPTAVMAVLYALSFIPMALALRRMDVAIAYAVWSAVGTALITMIGMVVFHESVTPTKMGAIAMIVAGVVVLNVAGRERAGDELARNSRPDVVENARK
ncbi:MAG TPA: multidrug efflux SMR transporter [Clostridia bacterium]|nr:multidrug efflux SMR transporter [Clostridia bacterium]